MEGKIALDDEGAGWTMTADARPARSITRARKLALRTMTWINGWIAGAGRVWVDRYLQYSNTFRYSSGV